MSLCGVELVELHPILRYSVDIFSIVGPTGILSYVRKPNTVGGASCRTVEQTHW